MIQLGHISRTFTKNGTEVVHALDDVSLELQRGELLAIVGSSGSGKSTLLNVLGLLDRPSSGTYTFEGQDVASLTPDEQARWRNQRLGFVFQSFRLLPRATALENVELPLLYSNRDRVTGLAQAALEVVGLSDRLRHYPSELSGGQQQRVAIARALVNEPDVLFADEPTGNLDTQSASDIMALFRQLNRQGCTVVLVTHDPQIATHCRRVARIEQGRIVSDQRVVVPRPYGDENKALVQTEGAAL
jgi:putative ABC transport system ATP-binding protein